MHISIPEELEQRLQPHLAQLSQRALEAIGAYANQLISTAEVQYLLQLPSHLANCFDPQASFGCVTSNE